MSVFAGLAAGRFSQGQLAASGDKISVIGENIIYSGNLFMYLKSRTGFNPSGSRLKETQPTL
jgi:hypothetical protein